MCPKIALRIAYDGSCFAGFQRQPSIRTVEGELIYALREVDAIRDPRKAHYRASSRTDRGVSAVGNVVSIDTDYDPERLPSAVNSIASDLWCTGSSIIPADYNVRYVKSRTYACYLLNIGQDIESMRIATKSFLGTHDFTRYARVDNRNPERTINLFEIREKDELIELIIEGNSFLWNQVRRMAWALDQVGRKYATASQVSPENYSLKRIGLIPAENLVLLSVDIGHEFKMPKRIGSSLAGIGNRFISNSVRTKMFQSLMNLLPVYEL